MLNLQLIEGFILGAGLLIALGPKDTFVIKNNLVEGNALALVLICAFSDAVLITLGVVGLGSVITKNRWVMVLTMAFSIIYLLYFGIRALHSAYLGQTAVDGQGVSPCANVAYPSDQRRGLSFDSFTVFLAGYGVGHRVHQFDQSWTG